MNGHHLAEAAIGQFPHFVPLQLAHRPAIQRITRRFWPYSEYAFGSLWAWDTDGSCRIALLHGNLVVRFKDFLSDAHFYSFLGNHRVGETAGLLLAHARAEGLSPSLRLIPEAVVTADARLRDVFWVRPDPANDDYILSVRDWAELSGPQYAGHRTKVRARQRRDTLEPRNLVLDDPETARVVMALFDHWAAARRSDPAEWRDERVALQRLFLPGGSAGLAGCGLYAADTLRGFTIWERVPDQCFSVHHFMKTDPAYPGLASLLIHTRSRILAEQGCQFANIEQDLGNPGLAAFKRSLRPCEVLRKYVITAQQSCGAEDVNPRGACRHAWQ